jgi:hypothetical protein
MAMKRLIVLALALAALTCAAAASPKPLRSATLTTRGPVVALAADGDRAAFMTSGRGRWHIVAWEPRRARAIPIKTIVDPGCSKGCGPGGSLALAGTRVAWDEAGGGNELETTVSSATIARRRALSLAAGLWDVSIDGGGDEAFGPTGDGKLLAFTVQVHCADPESEGEPPCPPGREVGDVVSATIWRQAGRGHCPSARDYAPLGHCQRVARANGELTVLSVDAGRIVARTDHGIRLLTATGRRLHDFPVENVRAAALSGDRLALRVQGAFEVYDTGSGELVKSFPAEGSARLDRLEDLDDDVLVTAMGRRVTLRRVSDGKHSTIHLHGQAHAKLEAPGLFVAGGRHVTFMPIADVRRRLT